MNKFLEIVKSHDITKAIISKVSNQNENSLVNGYVTITKNKGRKDEVIIQTDAKNLLTSGGIAFFHDQVYTNISAGTKGGNAIALSFDSGAPTLGDTTLVGEITTGGLTRVQATTLSTTSNVTTLANTFTATAVFADLHKSALFNQNTIGGQITHSSVFASDVSLGIGDTITVTWTLTLG